MDIMRNLNKDEQYIVHKLVQAKKSTNIKELCAAPILDEALDSIAVEWEDGKVTIYAEKNVNAIEQFICLCDVISLFQYLEQQGMIIIHRNPNLIEEKSLYNKKLYEKRGTSYLSKDHREVVFLGKPLVLEYTMNKQHLFVMVSDIISLLDKYACAFIHPTQELVDYVHNGFMTKEDKKYCVQKWISIIAIIVSFVVGFRAEVIYLLKYLRNIVF